MKPEIIVSIVQLTFTVVALFIGPLLAVHFSIKQFHSQKLWEKKVEVYQTLISDIAALVDYFDARFYSEVTDVPVPVDTPELKEAQAKLSTHSRMGGFILSKRAEAVLQKLVELMNPWKYECGTAYYDAASGALRDALKDLIDCARDDCNLDSSALSIKRKSG